MGRDHNKELVLKYFNSLTNKDWVTLENIFHEDLVAPETLFTNRKYSPFSFKVNSGSIFQKLLKKEKNTIEKTVAPYTDKRGCIEWTKHFAHINNYAEFIINDICVDEDKVWVSDYVEVVGPYQETILLNSFVRFWIKDGQIYSVLHQGRYLDALLQYVEVVVRQDDREGINNYIQALKGLGLIPESQFK